jgi:MFS family permease
MTDTVFLRNLAVMCVCQALSMSGSVMVFAVVALAGRTLAPVPELTTLPLGIQFVAMMAGTVPASLVMGRFGRRVGFSVGQVLGLTGGVVSAWALLHGSFWLFVAGAVPIGMHNAFFQFLRHAAADGAPSHWRARAISYVMAGGVVAGYLGPELAKRSAEALPAVFAGAYVVLSGLCLLNLLTLQFIRMPKAAAVVGLPSRSLSAIVRDPTFVVAAFSAMAGYGVMNLVMVAAPLAMVGCGFTFSDSADVIRWHVLGMFVPSFFTGSLIRRFGVLAVVATGAGLLAVALSVGLAGIAYANFWWALLLLGIGWNFMFVGGTTLLGESHQPHERAKVQGLNDLLVFGTTAMTSFGSGAVQSTLGWQAINMVSMVPVTLALGMVVMLARRRRAVTGSPAG